MSDLQICSQNFLRDMAKILDYSSFNPEVSHYKNYLLYLLIGYGKKIKDNYNVISLVPKTSKPVQLTDDIQYLYVQEEKAKLFALNKSFFAFSPQDSYVQWTELLKPMVEINDKLEIIKNYEKIVPGDRILIWQTVNEDPSDPGHLSCVIDCKSGEKYSFGVTNVPYHTVEPTSLPRKALSYNIFLSKEDTTLTEGIILSPDTIFLNKLTDQLNNRAESNFVQLVASAEINETHIALIKKEFDQIDYSSDLSANILVQVINPSPLDTQEHMREKELAFNQALNKIESNTSPYTTDPNKNKYLKEALSNTKQKIIDGEKIVLSFYYQMQLRNCAYTPLSGTKTRNVNCSSFLQKLFEGILSCSYKYLPLSDYFVSNPKNCRQITEIATCRPRETSQVRNGSTKFFTPMLQQPPNQSPELLFKFKSYTRKSPKRKSPKRKSPKRKSPKRKSPKRKSPKRSV